MKMSEQNNLENDFAAPLQHKWRICLVPQTYRQALNCGFKAVAKE